MKSSHCAIGRVVARLLAILIVSTVGDVAAMPQEPGPHLTAHWPMAAKGALVQRLTKALPPAVRRQKGKLVNARHRVPRLLELLSDVDNRDDRRVYVFGPDLARLIVHKDTSPRYQWEGTHGGYFLARGIDVHERSRFEALTTMKMTIDQALQPGPGEVAGERRIRIDSGGNDAASQQVVEWRFAPSYRGRSRVIGERWVMSNRSMGPDGKMATNVLGVVSESFFGSLAPERFKRTWEVKGETLELEGERDAQLGAWGYRLALSHEADAADQWLPLPQRDTHSLKPFPDLTYGRSRTLITDTPERYVLSVRPFGPARVYPERALEQVIHEGTVRSSFPRSASLVLDYLKDYANGIRGIPLRRNPRSMP